MKKLLVLSLIAIFAVFTLIGCKKKEPAETGNVNVASAPKTVAIIIPAAEHGWLAGVAYFAEAKVKALGLERGKGYRLLTSSSANEQANQIEEMISLNAAAIVLQPHNDEVSIAAQKIVNAGIPLVIFDRKVQSDYTAFVAGDNPAIGTKSAEYIGSKLNGQGIVAVLNVPKSGSVSSERVDAFKAVMASQYPDIKLVDMTAEDFTQQSGLKATTDMLTANKHVDAIFSIDDESSIGILQAIKDANRKEIKYLSGAGGAQAYFNRIASETDIECFTATYSPIMIQDVIAVAMQALNGETIAEKDVIIAPTVVTKENVSSMLDSASPY